MSQFMDRGKDFEAKFAHDEALRFKVLARRDRLLGAWAAEKFGLVGVAAENYALELVKAALNFRGDEEMIVKLKSDFAARGVIISDHQIGREIDAQMAAARRQMMEEVA